MRILVIGGGGREHALVWRLARAGHRLFCAPGNPGVARDAACVAVSPSDVAEIERAARRCEAELVVIGPEAPLVAGAADRLRAAGIPAFGPGADGARLEGSKRFCKALLERQNIPTAAFRVATTAAEADAAIDEISQLGARPGSTGGVVGVVVKADGLCGGKGVVVADDRQQARAAARAMLEDGRFGDAGRTVVIEERLVGHELSVMALTDGTRLAILAQAEDHKALGDGDVGPNTGGMGAVSPAPWATPGLIERVRREVLEPTLAGLRADGIDYRGVLYAGLMVGDDGVPRVLEYNCRFGDPETQPVMARWRGDPAEHLLGAALGQLPKTPIEWDRRAAVCVVLASPGYPGSARTGAPIDGLDALDPDAPDVIAFHAGTAIADGRVVTAGGRVLGITALADGVHAARARAYGVIDGTREGVPGGVRFPDMQYRRDIGARGADTGVKS